MSQEYLHQVTSSILFELTGENYHNIVDDILNILGDIENTQIYYKEGAKRPYLPYGDLFNAQIEIRFQEFSHIISIVEIPGNYVLIIVEKNVDYFSEDYEMYTCIIDNNTGSYEWLLPIPINLDLSSTDGYEVDDYIVTSNFEPNRETYLLVSECLRNLIRENVSDDVLWELIVKGLFENAYRKLMYVGRMYCFGDFLVIDGTQGSDTYITITQARVIGDIPMVVIVNVKKDYNIAYVHVSVHDLNTGERLLKYTTQQ